MGLFLSEEDLRTLTGYSAKGKQIEQLRCMGVPFHVNGCGRAVVATSAVEGPHHKSDPPRQQAWQPRVLQGRT